MRALPLLALVALALLTTPLPAGAVVPGSATVTVQFMVLLPPVVAVAPGGVLTFDSEETQFHHQLDAFDGTFRCHLMPEGFPLPSDVCSVTLQRPAGSVIPYRCTLHPFMVGAVVVA